MTQPERKSADLDKAFELLVVIIALIYSIMQSYPDLFWSSTPELSQEIQTMRNTVLPIIILTILWLASRMTSNPNTQLFLKSVSWMTAFSLGVALILAYLDGVRYIKFNLLLERILMGSIILLNPLVVSVLIFPKYKQNYVDATYFKAVTWPAASYLAYLVVMGVIVWIPSAMYAAW